jgi:hypothetical protein
VNDRREPTRSANDAVWWVVHHQGALDYRQSLDAADEDAAARPAGPIRTVEVTARDRSAGPRHP